MTTEIELFDTHCHLASGELGEDREAAWQRAKEAGVSRAVVIGINAEDCREVLAFVHQHDDLYCALGIHPNEVAKATPADWEEVTKLCQDEKVVAIGESGLDYFWDHATPLQQAEFLERHVDLAIQLDLPLVLHLRDAYGDAAKQLEPHVSRGLRGIIHCFGGQADEIHPFVDWGWPISFSGILTYSSAENVREAALNTPLEQCLIETDAPWLTPRKHGRTRNEPAFVRSTAEKLAKVKGITLEELASVTTENALRVFRL